MRTAVYVVAVLVVTAAFVKRGIAGGSDGNYTAARATATDAHGAQRVVVAGATGDLRIVAVADAGEVRVRGTAHASRRAMLDGIRIELRREGDVVVVRAMVPERTPGLFGGSLGNVFGRPARGSLDMVVEVPASLEADVTSGRGDTEVRGVSALRITDGPGDLQITDVGGPVRVRDSSGDLELSGIHGDVWLEDGSGDVRARHVDGSLVVATDGSGGLTASGVQGDVLVRRDGSGDIDVSGVGGRLTVEHDGSGDVRYRDVRGPVAIPQKKMHT